MWLTKHLPTLLLLATTAAAGEKPVLDIGDKECCRVWSASRRCIQAEDRVVWSPCHPVDTAPQNMPPDCAIMMLWSGECVEKKDGRENGWNASEGAAGTKLNSAIQAAGTLTTKYHHYTATFTATSPTEIVRQTTVTVESSTATTRWETITLTRGQTISPTGIATLSSWS